MVRFKNRYVLCEVVSEDPRCRQCIEDRTLGLAVRDAIARLHGDYGLACCSISFTGTIRTCQKFLIQYNRTQLLRLLQNCTTEGEERQCIQKSLLSCFLTEEQSQSGDEDDGTETD
uniref:Ribonuclease P/MRP protein subunit POP5 n=1 Tax=Corvus moneduloides TaxID=1196302 RepID=A0A8C3GZC7_CORMO